MPGTNTTPSGFSFGQPQTTPVQTTTKSLFGTTTSAPGGFNFGTGTTQQASSGFGLGSGTTPSLFPTGQPAATGGPTASGFSFGTTTPAAPAASTGGFSFGTTPATSSNTGFSLGGGSTFTPAATTASSTGFSFGTAPTTTPAPTSTSGFSLGSAGTATSTPSIGFSSGLLGQTQATKAPAFGFGAPIVTTTTTAAASATTAPTTGSLGGAGLGLGGAQPPSASTDANSSGSKTNGKSTKDQQLPQDLFATIALFEARKNAENAASEENIRQTAAPFHKIGEKAKEIQKVLAELASEYLQLQASTTNLKAEVMKEAEHVEMAKRTKETPMALQGDNKAPEMFFINLVRSFEAEMMYCRNKIEEVSLCMQAASNPCETQEDIAEVLHREHDTLKEMAAKVYSKHAQLVELSQLYKTKATPNEQAFFRPRAKEDTKTPASAVVRPVLGGGGSGLLAFQEQQQRAKAVTLGAAPPTMPLAHTTTPSMFSTGGNPSSIYSTGGASFGSTGFGLGTSSTFGPKPLFGNTSSTFGTNTGLQQTNTASPFAITSPFTPKPFGAEEDDADSRRKRRL